MINRIRNCPLPDQARLRALFKLTHAEARFARQIASGDSVEEIAHRLNIRITTALTQLAAIFDKTGTRRQAKLVAIMSRLAHLDSIKESACQRSVTHASFAHAPSPKPIAA